MTIALLSCMCRKDYDPAAHVGDEVVCKTHDVVIVVPEAIVLTCDDCTYRKDYDGTVRISVCSTATRHSTRKKHRVSHRSVADPDATMCVHDHRAAGVTLTDAGPPPF